MNTNPLTNEILKKPRFMCDECGKHFTAEQFMYGHDCEPAREDRAAVQSLTNYIVWGNG